MSETKKLNKVGLSQVWAKIVANFVAKQDGKDLVDTTLIQKLNNMKADGEANVIEKVSVNGVELGVSEKGVDITVPTGTLAGLDEVGQEQLSAALAAVIAGKAEKATTLEGYGITDAYTKTAADEAIATAVNQKVAGVYKIKGSVAFASLPTSDNVEGDVYNITDEFTANTTFVSSEQGKKFPAGTNVVYTSDGWDAMAGTYDFSSYMLKDDLVDITEDEINEICVMPV